MPRKTYEELERELATLRLLKDMDAIEVSALATFIRAGDIPSTIENARLVLVKRMLTEERELVETKRTLNDLQLSHTAIRDGLGIIHENYEKLEDRAEQAERSLLIAEIKNRGSLANNLCPDHRDKQAGKPCLACTIEQSERALARMANTIREQAELREQSEALVEQLQGALRPFAQFSSGFGRTARDDDWVLVTSPSGQRTITMGDVRAAEDLLRALGHAHAQTEEP